MQMKRPLQFQFFYSPEGGIGCCVTLRIGPVLGNLACWAIPIPACIIWAWAALYSGGGGLTPPIPPAMCCCCCITWKTNQTMDFNYIIKSRVSGYCDFETRRVPFHCIILTITSKSLGLHIFPVNSSNGICSLILKIVNSNISLIIAFIQSPTIFQSSYRQTFFKYIFTP